MEEKTNYLEEKIQKWLIDEGMFNQKVDDVNTNFHFRVNYPPEHNIDIIQPVVKKDMIVIGCMTKISDQHKQLMMANPDKNKAFIDELKLLINGYLLDFELSHPDFILDTIVITDEMYEDGITKNSLMNNIRKIFKVKIQAIWMMEKFYIQESSKNKSNSSLDPSMYV